MAPSFLRKSGVSTSIVVAGASARIASMVRTKCPAPPSSRSSRSTDVTTIWASPSRATASATCCGSCGSSRSGLPVATLQKVQARVQTLPRIITVACFCFQHSPILGQAASSQTVLSFSSRISLRVSWYSGEVGALTRIQSGLRRTGLSGLCAFSGWRRGASLIRPAQRSEKSDVENLAVGVKHGLVHHLRQRRVREYRAHQLLLGELAGLGDGVALDELGHLGAH